MLTSGLSPWMRTGRPPESDMPSQQSFSPLLDKALRRMVLAKISNELLGFHQATRPVLSDGLRVLIAKIERGESEDEQGLPMSGRLFIRPFKR